MRGIGEAARASGLSVSALRFYDGAGVLIPAEVDPATGYRRYADTQIRSARLIARLRRVGLPVPEIARALQNPDLVRVIVDHHRRRLESGYADAQRELSRIYALLDLEEKLMTTVTLPARELATAMDAVRWAASTADDVPALHGVLAETDESALLLWATDRYRVATAQATAAVEGPATRLVLPMSFIDEIRPGLSGGEPVTLELEEGRVRLGDASAAPVESDYPDMRRLMSDQLGRERRFVPVDVATLRGAIASTPRVVREIDGDPYEIVILGVDPAGSLRCAAEAEWAADTDAHVAVNREFLLQALDAGGAGQLRLELDGPIKPLIIRADEERFSLLMPVRR
jgi:DNA-binding transcriptional MerR regulator